MFPMPTQCPFLNKFLQIFMNSTATALDTFPCSFTEKTKIYSSSKYLSIYYKVFKNRHGVFRLFLILYNFTEWTCVFEIYLIFF